MKTNISISKFKKLSAEMKQDFINDYYWTEVEPISSIYYLGTPDEEDIAEYKKATEIYDMLCKIIENEISEDREIYGVDLYNDERYYKAM